MQYVALTVIQTFQHTIYTNAVTLSPPNVHVTVTPLLFPPGPGYGLVPYILPAPNYRESYHLKFGSERYAWSDIK